jgi:hypothetical protein
LKKESEEEALDGDGDFEKRLMENEFGERNN